MMQQPGLFQKLAEAGRGMRTEPFAVLDRQLERRALDVADEDFQVVGIDLRVLRRGVEEVRRVLHDELIQRRTRRYQQRQRKRLTPPRPAGALPGRSDRPRIACHHDRIERTDVDPQFERVRRNNAHDLAFAQLLFDFTAFSRQVAAPVASNRFRRKRAPFSGVLEVADENLGRQAAVCEDKRLLSAFEEAQRQPAGLGDVAPANPQLPVHHRRIVEREETLALGSPVRFDLRHRLLDKLLGKLFRIGDRRRTADEQGL